MKAIANWLRNTFLFIHMVKIKQIVILHVDSKLLGLLIKTINS